MAVRRNTLQVWLFATLWAVLGILPVIVLGLTVPGRVIVPMAMALGGLFSALAASWASNGYAADGSRSRVLAVVGVTEVAAMLAAGLLFLVFGLIPLPLLVLVVLFGGGIGRTAAWAALRFRAAAEQRWHDVALSVLLVLLGVLIVVVGLSALCSTAVDCHA